jgi:hypothetical protein
MAPLLQRAVKHLEEAMQHASNETEVAMLAKYIER